MKKNCLNCKYEPDWSEWSGGEYSRCHGACKWSGEIPVLPAVYTLGRPRSVGRYSDDSGIHECCKTWEAK